MQLRWRRSADGSWCAFETAVLPDPPASGIVVVWAGGSGETVYVADGAIAKNIRWARQFERIARRGSLFVTWATLAEDSQSGVRNYLVETLRPVICDRPTPDQPIAVNLPWEAE